MAVDVEIWANDDLPHLAANVKKCLIFSFKSIPGCFFNVN